MKILISEPATSLIVSETVYKVIVSNQTVIGTPRAVGFQTITVSPTPPPNPQIGDIWIKPKE